MMAGDAKVSEYLENHLPEQGFFFRYFITTLGAIAAVKFN